MSYMDSLKTVFFGVSLVWGMILFVQGLAWLAEIIQRRWR